MKIEQVIQERASTRCFDSLTSIDKDHLKRYLYAGMQAPSPKNRQPWLFTVVNEQETKKELAQILETKLIKLEAERRKKGKDIDDLKMAQGSVQVLQNASSLIFVSYERDVLNDHSDMHNWELQALPFEAADLQAIGAAIENMILTATADGVDSLWMCDVLYAYQEYMDYMNLSTPLIACVALGYRSKRRTERMPFEKKVKFF